MRGLSLSLALLLGGVASAQTPAPLAPAPVGSVAQAPIVITDAPIVQGSGSAVFD